MIFLSLVNLCKTLITYMQTLCCTNEQEQEQEQNKSTTQKKKRKLLVLDLNGILVDVVDKTPLGYTPDIRIRGKSVFKRPFCDDFLKFCFENFDVGIWSSRMKKNIDGLVDFLMRDMNHQLLFCWDQSHCTKPGLKISQTKIETTENKHKQLLLKELKYIWENYNESISREDGNYNESSTLLLDDSPYKAILNPPHTAVFPDSYTFRHENDSSLGPGGDIRVYLEGLVMAENVQNYVEKNPFGQAPIPPSSQLYCQVVNIIKYPELTDRRKPSTRNQQSRGVGRFRQRNVHQSDPSMRHVGSTWIQM